jgi:hypothetical protein
MHQTRFIIVTLFVAGWANVTSAQTKVEKLIAESDLAIQAQIRTTLNAFLSRPRSEIKTNPEACQQLETLKGLAGDNEKIVKQLAIFAVTEQRDEDQQVLEAILILQLLDLKPSIPIRVLAPYLDSDNKQLHDFAREWFQGHDKTAGEDPLKAYKSYVRERLSRNEEIPVAFIEYVYERLPPGKALVVFHFGQWPPQKKDSDVILAEHIVSDAIWLKENRFAERFQKALPEANAELAKLAKHKEWWVRLYVAWMMRRHPEVRQADVLQLLSADNNKLVREAAKSVRRP